MASWMFRFLSGAEQFVRFSSCLPERAGWSFTGRHEGFLVFRNVVWLSEQFFQAGRDDSPYLDFLFLCRSIAR